MREAWENEYIKLHLLTLSRSICYIAHNMNKICHNTVTVYVWLYFIVVV